MDLKINKSIFRNIKNLLTIQELLISLTNKSILKMPITDDNEFKGFNKVISSLCDVGCLISSADIKTTIETWRVVVKLSEKFNNCYKYFPIIKIENCTDSEKHWYDKAILGIFKELKQILQLYKRTSTSNNDNLLQIAQFYLKILRLLIHYSKDTIKSFPASKDFFKIYSLCQHEILKNENPQCDLFIKKGLYDIFLLIHDEKEVVECLLQHLKTDVDNFESCALVLDYLKVNIEYYSKNRNIKLDVEVLLKLYNGLFEGPLFFVDKHKYCKILENFVILIALDLSNELHKKLCEYVVDLSWIRAYASMEILNMYYSYILKQQRSETNLKCYEFWLKMWNKLNISNEKFRKDKKLIEILLKTIIHNITSDKLQQYNCNKYENMEIILLLCGQETEQCRQYLQTNLIKYLRKLQERHINCTIYRELLNLMEICALKPHLLNHNLMECILNTLTGLFSLPSKQLNKFREFINKTLTIFYLKADKQLNDKLLTILNDHDQSLNIQSVILIEFLLKQRPQSTKLLLSLQSHNKLTTNIQNLLENSTLTKKSIDIKVFKDLNNNNSQQSESLEMDQEQIRKRPRLDKGNFSNIKTILNDLNLNTQKLLQFERINFDAKDFALIRQISKNLDKCLTNENL